MKYLVLIYDQEALWASMSQEEQGKLMGEYLAFTEEVSRRGTMVSGEALQPISTATTVRVRDGKTVVTNGPFAETKEQLGGYYLLDCQNLDEAIELATKLPAARYGSVEIRPVMEFND